MVENPSSGRVATLSEGALGGHSLLFLDPEENIPFPELAPHSGKKLE